MSGNAGWLRVYLADIRPLYREAMQKRVYERLDETRRRKADGCKQPGARAASLAAGFLAQHALWDNGYADCKVCYGETGQPFVCRECMTEQATPYISLSHSGDYAVCAICDRPVGVDIQKIQPVRHNMLRHFFAEEEECAFRKRCGLEGSTTERAFLPEEAAREFLRLWTVKESYMKLAGAGLLLGLSNVAADLEHREAWLKPSAPGGGTVPAGGTAPQGGNASETGTAPKARRTCRIRELKAPDGYFLTVCIDSTKALQEEISVVELETVEKHEKSGVNACFNEWKG